MSVQRAQQAQEILGKSALVRMTERGDEVALLIGPMGTRGLPEVVDRPLPRPGTQRGLRWGWTAGIWLASILTEGDPRTGAGATDLTGMPPLRPLTAQGSAPLEVRDDRVHPLRHHWSTPA